MNPFRWYRRRRIRRKIRIAKAALRFIDKFMAKAGMPAWKRQQIRRDIVTSDRAWIDYLSLFSESGNGSGAVLRARDEEMYQVLANAFPAKAGSAPAEEKR